MCIYLFSSGGGISIEYSQEAIYIRPKYYFRPNGHSTIAYYCKIKSLNDGIDSLLILYPNKLKGFVDLVPQYSDWSGLKGLTDYSVSRLFQNNADCLRILNLLPYEILSVTFSRPLKKGEDATLFLRFESPDASDNASDFYSSTIKSVMSGPSGVRRSFEQGIQGAEEQFLVRKRKSTKSVERDGYSKMISAIDDINSKVVTVLNTNEVYHRLSKMNLIYDPKLININVDTDGNIKEIKGQPDFKWPYKSWFDRIMLVKDQPKILTFQYEGGGEKDHKFVIESTASMKKLTIFLLATASLVFALLAFATRF